MHDVLNEMVVSYKMACLQVDVASVQDSLGIGITKYGLRKLRIQCPEEYHWDRGLFRADEPQSHFRGSSCVL